MFTLFKVRNNNQLLFISFLILFTLFNLFSAVTMGIHYDEAYYWLYSRSLSWGYFDHPPMIAWLIFVGNKIFDSILGVRLFVVIISSLSILNLWIIVKPYGENARLFWSIIFSVMIIHPYSFIATPDAPLFFFTTLFFVLYRKYLHNDNFINVFSLALVSSLLFYSKYQGVLIPFFVVLTNLKLLRKWSFWLCIFITALLMVPHLLWQINHNFASLQYHLIDSHKAPFDPMLLVEYVFSQLLIAGPWLGWLFFMTLGMFRANYSYEKALKWSAIGIFVFFFITTFGGDFEADWTYVAVVPLVAVSYVFLMKKEKWHKWLYRSALANVGLLLIAKIIVITPLAGNLPVLKMYYGWDTDTEILKTYTANYPVVFQDTWNKAARFAWYTRDVGVSNLNSGQYRKNQFDIWQKHEKIKGETVYVVTLDSLQFTDATRVETPKEVWYMKKIKNFRSYYKLTFSIEEQNFNQNQIHFTVRIDNPYDSDIEFDKSSLPLTFGIYDRRPGRWFMLEEIDMANFHIEAKHSKTAILTFSHKNESLENAYLMMKVGELKPIPVRYKIMN